GLAGVPGRAGRGARTRRRRLNGGTLHAQCAGIPGQFQVAAADLSSGFDGAYRAFPVHGAGARARVEFLVVEQGLERERARADRDRHRDRIACTGTWRRPVAGGYEPWRDVATGRCSRRRAAGIDPARVRPEHAAVAPPDAERDQRRAVVEVQARPVPSVGRRVEDLAGPFVVEPGDAGDANGLVAEHDRPGGRQLRTTVVVARLRRPPALAR